ncbi:MAG: hypothetical protein ABSC94_12960 [Polyangiaceae bacterium]|jgi:hypothetical protein
MNAEYIGEKSIWTVGFAQPAPASPTRPVGASVPASAPPAAELLELEVFVVLDADSLELFVLLLQAVKAAPSASTPAVDIRVIAFR